MMPEKSTVERAEKDKREGKAPSAQAGEFVREEMHHVLSGSNAACTFWKKRREAKQLEIVDKVRAAWAAKWP